VFPIERFIVLLSPFCDSFSTIWVERDRDASFSVDQGKNYCSCETCSRNRSDAERADNVLNVIERQTRETTNDSTVVFIDD
jgi:hypothetical protein